MTDYGPDDIFERITYRTAGGTRRTVFLERPVEFGPAGARILRGTEVDRDGNPVEPPRKYLRQHGAETGKRLHLIEAELIIGRQRMRENLTHGGLEIAPDEDDSTEGER